MNSFKPSEKPMSEAPLMNDEAARSPSGEILDQSTTPPTTPTPTTPDTTPGPTPTVSDSTPSSDTKPEVKPGETLLTDKKPPDATTYTDFKAPDGYTLDPKAIEAVLPIFKELGLSQDAAQRLVDAQIARDIANAKAPQETYAALRSQWQTETLNHPDIKSAHSGDKIGIDAVKAEMGRALSAIGDPVLTTQFKQAMDLTGAGDNPAFVRTFLKMAAFITEGTHVTGKGPSPEGQRAPGAKTIPSAAQALYPNLPSAG